MSYLKIIDLKFQPVLFMCAWMQVGCWSMGRLSVSAFPEKNESPFASNYQLPIAVLLGLENHEHLLICTGFLGWLDHVQGLYCHSCYGFRNTVVLSCSESHVSQHAPPSSGSYSISTFSWLIISELWQGAQIRYKAHALGCNMPLLF